MPSNQTVCCWQSPWTVQCYSSYAPNPTHFCSLPEMPLKAVSPLPLLTGLVTDAAPGAVLATDPWCETSPESHEVSGEASSFTAGPRPLTKAVSCSMSQVGNSQPTVDPFLLALRLSSGRYTVYATHSLLFSTTHTTRGSQAIRVYKGAIRRKPVVLLPSCPAKMPCSQGSWGEKRATNKQKPINVPTHKAFLSMMKNWKNS